MLGQDIDDLLIRESRSLHCPSSGWAGRPVANGAADGPHSAIYSGVQAMNAFKGRHFEGEIVLWAVR